MPENLFERAKSIGLLYITQWLPNGKREGDEWSAINPTRNDKNQGSFKINLKTGKWMDGSTGDKGGDSVSLYAYLNQDKLSFKAAGKKYKNHNAGIQTEAAKEILMSYDNSYFPGKHDDFTPSIEKSKKNYWDSFNRVFLKKDEKPPEFDPSFYEKNWGSFKQEWDFFENKKFIFKVVRFIDNDGKKSDRPFTLWTNGNQIKWRSKRCEKKYPLWNVDELQEHQNREIVLWEGQKDASIGKKYIKDFISIGWYQGAGNTDQTEWYQLRGREVWYIFDADISGRKSIGEIKKISKEYDFILHLVYPPADVKKGWSLADELFKGLSSEEFKTYLNASSTKIDKKYIDDNPFEFKILGYSGEYITFYPFGSKKVIKHKATAIGKSTLMTLMDRSLWGDYYAKSEGGIAWDCATNDILRIADNSPVFDPSIIRGSGAWMDDGKLIINTGNHLLIDGKKHELFNSPGSFVYERGLPMPYTIENQATTEDIKTISQIVNKFKWTSKIYSKLLLGWILLAPFGGALKWRPHIWITGRKGSGKSWILENILYPLIGIDFGIRGFGTSTPAGVRNALCNTSKCTIMDEMESDNLKYTEYIDQIMKAFREGSSGSGYGAATLHGSSDGEGRQWIVQSMACFASIGAAIKCGADKSRFTILPLDIERNHKKREKNFDEICKNVKFITRILGRSIVSRTLNKFDNVIKSIDIMINQMIDYAKNKRESDQIGTLLGGAWMFENDEPPTASIAKEWLKEQNIEILKRVSNDKPDEELCISEILNGKIELTNGALRVKMNISSVLEYWYLNESESIINENLPIEDMQIIKRELSQTGIKTVNKNGKLTIRFAINHPGIKKILKETPWQFIYDEMLTRLDIFICRGGPDRFAGVSYRFVELDALNFFEDIPF